MIDRGSEVPNVRRTWVYLINEDGSGEDVFINPASIERVEVRPNGTLRIFVGGVRFRINNPEATLLVNWLKTVSGLILRAQL